MIVTLEEVKSWIRVDSTVEDALIQSFIVAAEEIVEGVLRYPLSDLIVVPEVVRQAIIYAVSQFYESREALDIAVLTENIRGLLTSTALRREVW